jgi:DNA-binding FadR family transcriptional regulator
MAAVDVTKLLEARELLETPAAGLAAVRRTPEQLETLRATLSDAGQEADRVQLYEQNKLFHTTILEAADNPLLQLMTQPVFAVVRARFLPAISPESFWPRVDCDHRTIFDAIERGDRNAAEDAMRVHLAHLGSTYEGIEPKTPIGD